MTVIRSLRVRVTVAFTAMACLLSCALAVAAYRAAELMEGIFIQATLAAELDALIERHRTDPASFRLPHSLSLEGWVVHPGAGGLPPHLAGLPTGVHELSVRDRELEVLVAERDDHLYVLAYDETPIEVIEGWLVTFLVAGVLAFTVAAAWLSGWFSAQIIAPVTDLAQRVRAAQTDDDPLDPGGFADDEVGALARVVAEYQRRLQAGLRREERFCADVSHELRTSLGILGSHLDLLADDPTLGVDTGRRVGRMQSVVEAMRRHLDAFLLLARPGSASEGEPCEVAAVVEETVARRLPTGPGGPEVVLSVVDRTHHHVPRGAAEIVLGNLLDNAIRHAHAGRIEVRVDDTGVSVVDDGCGIPADELPRLTDRAFRGRGADAGSGLGLEISRRLCEVCAWRLEIESEPGEGTRVRVAF